MGYINPAWSRCVIRFKEVQDYIEKSAAVAPFGDGRYRAELYGTWVLMAYAACEYSLNEIGKACVEFIGARASTPSKLPEEVQRKHLHLTLDAVRRLLVNNGSLVDIESALQKIHSAQWAAHSSLMIIDRNVWPDVVREWLSRLGVTKSDLAWMEKAVPGKTDTYSSRMAALVAERNPIAHGVAVAQIRDSNLMKDWVQDCQDFVEKCAMSITKKLVVAYQPRLSKIGHVDKQTQLGPNTLALSFCMQSVEVGDHVVLKSTSSVKAARIMSLMSNGSPLNSAIRGMRQISIGLSKSHGGANLYMAP